MAVCPPWLIEDGQSILARHAEKKLPHALLITGVVGIGKRQFAHWLVEALLCQQLTASGACRDCPSCRQLRTDGHPDFRLLLPEGASSTIKVDAVRELVTWMQLTAAADRYRIALLEGADRMNRNSANSLLKTLEEPSERAILVLVADSAGALPATIRSRCQKLTLRLRDRAVALSWLSEQVEGDPEIILRRGANAPFAALAANSDEHRQSQAKLLKAWEDLFLHRGSIGRIVESLKEFDTRQCLESWVAWCALAIRLQAGLPSGADPALEKAVAVTAPCLTSEQWFTVRDRILHLHRIDSASFRTSTVLEGLLADMRYMISG